jgi:hypothetical protein
MNFVLNFECLFWFLFQLTLTSDLKEVQFTQNYLFWVKAPLQYLEGAPNFKTLPWLKNINNNKYSKFDTRLVIWRPVEMTWSRPLNQGGGVDRLCPPHCYLLPRFSDLLTALNCVSNMICYCARCNVPSGPLSVLANTWGLSEAISNGLARDGGLYVPKHSLPKPTFGQMKRLVPLLYKHKAHIILEKLIHHSQVINYISLN